MIVKTAAEREAFINFAFFYAEAFARVRLVKKNNRFYLGSKLQSLVILLSSYCLPDTTGDEKLV